MISRCWMLRLFSGAVILPVALAVLFLVRQLLGALGDESAARLFERLEMVLLFAWGVNLIALLLALTARHLFPTEGE